MEPWQFVSENRGLDKTHDVCPVVRKYRRKLTPHTAVYGIIYQFDSSLVCETRYYRSTLH